jgi:3-methyladenine DNA glycosylase/8-oxoguanine DNA glycosylase
VANIGRIALVGPGGEPVDFWRTVCSHGLTSLPPVTIDEESRSFAVTLRLPGGPRTVRVSARGQKEAEVTATGAPLPPEAAKAARTTIRHMLRLDADLSPFYALAQADPALAWCTRGAGRMARSATAFEDIIKTVCTTNCAWSGTVRMVRALVEHLGEPTPDAPESGWEGRAFPTAAAMAEAPESFYRDTVRAGYRAAYLRAIATMVADGSLDLEGLACASEAELPDDELAKRLLALPGIGPYAAAHAMTLFGRSSRLILDSWTRPTYAARMGNAAGNLVPDADITARFAPYGSFAGLAFWLVVTEDWIASEDA